LLLGLDEFSLFTSEAKPSSKSFAFILEGHTHVRRWTGRVDSAAILFSGKQLLTPRINCS
jgi:hypothetical protein